LKKSQKIIVVLLGVLGLLLILPFLIPTAKYLAQFERLASELGGVPVKVENAHLYFIPSPRLSLEGVTVGHEQDITVKSLVVVPSITSLFSSTRAIVVNIYEPVIKDTAIPFITKLADSSSDHSAPAVMLTELNVQGLLLLLPSIKLPQFNLHASFDKGAVLSRAEIVSEDKQLEASLVPNEAGYAIVVNMQDWKLPLTKPFVVNSGQMDIVLSASKLDIPNISLRLYGGTLSGKAILDWQKAWQLSGTLQVKDLLLKEPTQMLNASTYLGGRLLANGKFSANASSPDQLLNQLRANLTFRVNQGVLYGLDLVKVASFLVKQSAKGGQTQFDTFTGQLAVTGKRYHLKQMDVSSGLISAKGDVKINELEKLNGTGEVALKQSVGLVSVPLIVSGTLDNPVVLPSKAALAGAAVGTAILGPGLGTSLGSKAGSAVSGLKNLFGGGDE
jgi:hypothetical protein